jgi:hypothetical protein
MLTPNMTPRGSLQLSYLIVGKFPLINKYNF